MFWFDFMLELSLSLYFVRFEYKTLKLIFDRPYIDTNCREVGRVNVIT